MEIGSKPEVVTKRLFFSFCAFLSLFFLLGSCLMELHAQNKASTEKGMSAEILFRIGKSDLDLDYMNNRAVISSFMDELKPILSDSNYVINELKIVGAASPDGMSEKVNLRLAHDRALSIKRYIISRVKIDPSIIKIENKGENWQALRAMVVASDMPCRDEILKIFDANPNRNERKQALMRYQHSVPYLYMYKHFFPVLRSGKGDTSGNQSSGIVVSRNTKNWELLKRMVSSSDAVVRHDLQAVFDTSSDPQECLEKLKTSDRKASYEKIQSKILEPVLYQADSLDVTNWKVLRKSISSSSMQGKEDVLFLIDNTSITRDRENKLKTLAGGEPYEYIKRHFFSNVLFPMKTGAVLSDLSEADYQSLINENWHRLRYIIDYSEIDTKKALLDIIDGNKDPYRRVEEIQKLNNGETYKYLCDVYMPILLYGLSPLSLQNWSEIEDRVSECDAKDKDEVLHILRTVPVSMGRKEKLEALNGGCTFNAIKDKLFDNLLLGTRTAGNSGLSLSYQLTPAAIKKMEWLQRLADFKNDVTVRVSVARFQPAPVAEIKSMPGQSRITVISVRPGMWTIGTNLAYLGALLPNLEVQGLLSGHLSLVVEGLCAWWSQPDKHRYYQIAGISPELRYWTGREALKGQYLGLMIMGGLYDLENKKQGYQGEYLAAGLTCGYFLRLNRHFSFDFGLGLGFLFTQYRKYLPENDKYVYQYTDKYRYTGPLKVKIGLVWRPWKKVKK